ncbi:methyltransferase domain-containing protein [Tribonema minus]|uniref:Methyltransferase domain-containing protein n=1 Tax=Tribonema minus TaxID=303371 RepID=A0A835ZCF3_9STRA|nr:methyltransferase domain-containing protein [Tribonema minus]
MHASYYGDGPKFVCGVELLRERPDCLVYSIGSNMQDGFELGLQIMAPNCEVHVFDPTVDVEALGAASAAHGYRFHLMGLGSKAQSDGGEVLKNGPLRTLQHMMEELGHTGRTIDIFKIDCEGCEWDTLGEQVFAPMREGHLKIGQLQVEMHLYNRRRLGDAAAFFEAADAAGMRIFHKERNHWGCGGWKCLEYAFISADWARFVYHKTHCPEAVEDPAELGSKGLVLQCD